MKLTGPHDIRIASTYEKLVEALELELQKEGLAITNGVVKVLIPGEYPATDRQKAVVAYTSAGWETVSHTSSSENGATPGMTLFTFIKR